MKRHLQSLYGRLTLVYLALLLAFSAISVVLLARTGVRFWQESAQRLNLRVAESLAGEIAPYLGPPIDLTAVEHEMHVLMHLNPWVEIYLLDAEGGILTYKAEPGDVRLQRVPLEPVRAFLAGSAELPVLGPDPKAPEVGKIFSAATVDLGDSRGYLYVVLQGAEYASAVSMVRENYFLRGATLTLLLAFGFTAAVGALLFFGITARFRKLASTVRGIEQGDLSRRVPHPGDDEIGALGRAVNQMADKVQSGMQLLEERDEFRRRFIANITHDLRSPLTSIQGFVETILMKDDTISSEDRLEYLTTIQDETARLNRLVDQLLELARLDAEEIRPRLEPFLFDELAQDVLQKVRPRADHLGITIDICRTEGLPQTRADIAMMERVLLNLLDNALRHTPAGGRIEICTAPGDGRLEVRVSDTGTGIPADELPHVGERFFRGRRSRELDARCTGLGLSIVRGLLALHGAVLDIRSREGAGTTVSFSVPVAA